MMTRPRWGGTGPRAFLRNRSALIVLLSLLATGCGGGDENPSGTAVGVVKFKGEPIEEGMIYLYNPQTAYANQATITKGKFEFPDTVRTGTYNVYVAPIPPAPGSPYDPVKMVGTGSFPAGVTKKYQYSNSSDLTLEIKEGVSEVELEIPES